MSILWGSRYFETMETFCSSNFQFIYLYYYSHDFLFHSLSYNVIIATYFNVQIVSDGVWRSPFKLAPVSFWHVSIVLWIITCFLAQGVPALDQPFLQGALSPNGQWYESHNLGARDGHCYWGVAVPKLESWTVCVHTTYPHLRARLQQTSSETMGSPQPDVDTLIPGSGCNTTQPGRLGPDFSALGALPVDTLHRNLSSPCSSSEKAQVDS